MTFKDHLATDLANIFFNDSEFAETATYNGKQIEIIPDATMLQSTSVPGVIVPGMTVYVRADQQAKCKQGDKIVHDGNTYYVSGMPMLEAGIWTLQVDRETKSLSYGV